MSSVIQTHLPQSPPMIEQELWGYLLTHYAISALTCTAATAAGIDPDRVKPKRTIRAVMWGAEEMDFSDDAYAAAHVAEAGRIVLAGESDSGADRVYSLQLPTGAYGHPAMAGLSQILAPLMVSISPDPARRSGRPGRFTYLPVIALRPAT